MKLGEEIEILTNFNILSYVTSFGAGGNTGSLTWKRNCPTIFPIVFNFWRVSKKYLYAKNTVAHLVSDCRCRAYHV